MKDIKKKILEAREKKNQNLIHASLEMQTSTHFPMLIEAVSWTTGPIIEIGSGLFSTPLLHWLCFKDKRQLITIENYKHYLKFANQFKSDFHEVVFVDPKERPPVSQYYGVVFIDHSPKKPITRGADALLFKDNADFIVMHDAGPNPNPKYGYKDIYPEFKYVRHWEEVEPNTTVLSNSKNPNEWI